MPTSHVTNNAYFFGFVIAALYGVIALDTTHWRKGRENESDFDYLMSIRA